MTERTDSVATAPADVPALQVTDLLKHYADADRNVFDGISFSVPKGKVLVIVGDRRAPANPRCCVPSPVWSRFRAAQSHWTAR